MAKKRSAKTEKVYSFSEYLEKFRPRALPEGPQIDPRSDRLAAEIIEKAVKKIRKSSEQTHQRA
jgi:hypothetical protein